MKSYWASKHLAELLGTFGLTLAVYMSATAGGPVPVPVAAALTLGIFVYTVGGISGCHINPSVTVGLWSAKKISSHEAAKYVLMQVIGALLAMLTGQFLTGASPMLLVEDTLLVGLAEAIGAAFLAFGVSAVAHGKVSHGASGATVGGSLLIGIVIASSASNAVLNPAVALGIGSLSLMYVIGPLAGGIIGAQLYKMLVE